MAARISPRLAERLRSAIGNDPVDVVVELASSGCQEPTAEEDDEAFARWRADFDERAARVGALVEQLGGQVTAGLWLDETLRVSMPARSVGRLASVAGVEGLDVPRRLRVD